MTETKLFYSAAEVSQLLGISVGQTYRLMRQWNAELAAKHYLVIAGKIPVAYFHEIIYGGINTDKLSASVDNDKLEKEITNG